MASFEEEATQLHKAGWQQCSTFYPNDKIGGDLGLPEGAVLLVLTQACSVVSYPLKRDPQVELIVATKSQGKFNPRAAEARGGNARKFLVQLDDGNGPAPYLLDIYQRHFAPRELLLEMEPNGPRCSDEDVVRVANWVGRFYTRTALPTELVNRLKAAGFQEKLNAILSEDFDGETLHEQVAVIFGRWEPNDEEGPYRLLLNIAVRSIAAQDRVLEVLKNAFRLPGLEIEIEGIDGVQITIEVPEISTVTLESFEEMRRISDWDLLSGLKEEV
ncbi:hypothetical protein J2855_004958 [Agrobacterium tumefaciens]|jgi:hypothetical protein|uniref:hypothetical protein n=1 Tax=Agrobacterium tumefaciens TaxID=358 RepID=UPI000DCF6429|nr:hypothetical protein [Agrobacterium tumefaciens]MBP2511303.1 hypothetical protein [Agrobacterium tumefaciens]MBP2520566.1 hypothetical protein [Agrobacterium tumefaciens]MBP2579235.1 hypothetical protein [Agrobacterium tumefaciens]MBP2597528.1 hypothetical protein [Agrobacterium tumefaciens]